jgi:hypothetical protein
MSHSTPENDVNRWREWSRVPPDQRHAQITLQTAGGQRLKAHVANESVNGLALLIAQADALQVGQTLRLWTPTGPRNGTVAYVEPHGLVFRVGVTFGTPPGCEPT